VVENPWSGLDEEAVAVEKVEKFKSEFGC